MMRITARSGALPVLAFLIGLAGPDLAHGQIGSERYAAIVQDARTGATLMAANADEHRHPASLTKMMTLYMLFEALRDGRVSLSTPITMSHEAAAQPPSKLGLPPGATLTVEQAILALVTKSANDVAYAVGEHLGGTESRFAQIMTLRARALGMTRSTFRNASGLPDPDQVTSARDMALLGRRLREDFPAYYHYFAAENFRFRGRVIWNHNRLLGEYEGTDGIKTGYVNDSGFNLVASVQRDGQRLVAAVFGGASGRERDRHMMDILDAAFARLGVAPRDTPMVVAAPRPGLGLVPSARADTLSSRAPRGRLVAGRDEPRGRVEMRPPPRGRHTAADARARPVIMTTRSALGPARGAQPLPAPMRQAGTRRQAANRQDVARPRGAVRIEQGDRTPLRADRRIASR